MSLAEVFNQLGQSVIPQVTAAVFPDLMTITGQTVTQDEGGGDAEVPDENPKFENVPVNVKPITDGRDRIAEDSLNQKSYYELKFPVYHEGERITIDKTTDRLIVQARGLEPETVYGIEKVWNNYGVHYIARCTIDD